MISNTQFQQIPVNRASYDEILEHNTLIESSRTVQDILNAISIPLGILNRSRQFVFCNKQLSDLLNIKDKLHVLGKRPGEALNCIHHEKGGDGCGTSEYCQVCSAFNTLIQSIDGRAKASSDCRITSKVGNEELSHDLRVTAAPIELHQETFTLLSIEDVSDTKRRRALEKLFFHDIINSAGSLFSIIDMSISNPDFFGESLLPTLKVISNSLMDEIFSQRQLTEAENSELKIEPVPFEFYGSLQEAIKLVSALSKGYQKTITLETPPESSTIISDPVIFKRVIINLLKNALEATAEGEAVSIDYTTDSDSVTFRVHNPGYIPREIQLQLFQRSFTTKGPGRGLGTYSIKLLTQRYLKGTVSFLSTPEQGTSFTITIPRTLNPTST